jgi:putative endonuclease
LPVEAESTKTIGTGGEESAARFLTKAGYRIIASNWRAAGGEIDLVAGKDDLICFVEVKTRRSEDFGQAENFVTRRKQLRIIRAAKCFLRRKTYRDCAARFDIVTVIHDGKTERIEHFENAFEE